MSYQETCIILCIPGAGGGGEGPDLTERGSKRVSSLRPNYVGASNQRASDPFGRNIRRAAPEALYYCCKCYF